MKLLILNSGNFKTYATTKMYTHKNIPFSFLDDDDVVSVIKFNSLLKFFGPLTDWPKKVRMTLIYAFLYTE